ncbi:hypothetical protein ACN9JG_01500 [Cereibacter azotoformans]|uniref:hypothetical protein n=1 Tax=Cereibacter azotoformans TaxID=43057 RepID=UPI003B224F92
MSRITRRSALAGAPLAIAAATTAQAADSPFRRLWREHRAAVEAFNASPLPDGHPELMALRDRSLALEEQAARTRPRSLEDLAWLVLFADDDGAFEGASVCADPLLSFCRDIVEVTAVAGNGGVGASWRSCRTSSMPCAVKGDDCKAPREA